MKSKPHRQPQAIRRRQTKRISHLEAIERLGRNPNPLHLAWIAPPRKSRWERLVLASQEFMDRSAEASWRLHDGMPAAWVFASAIVLSASFAATVCVAAMTFGGKP
jgi:hypothetical protein